MNFFKMRKIKELKVILWSFGEEGKTNLLYRGLKGIKDFQTLHTVGINVETTNFNGVNITFWDIGGACKIKDLRKSYFPYADAIIFLIDSSESVIPTDINSNFKYNFEEFKKCIEIIEDKPFLIAITKIDKRKVSTLDIIEAYQLYDLFKTKNKFGIIECSSFTLKGIKEIEFWLTNII